MKCRGYDRKLTVVDFGVVPFFTVIEEPFFLSSRAGVNGSFGKLSSFVSSVSGGV